MTNNTCPKPTLPLRELPTEPMLSVPEFAEIASISAQKVRSMIREGELRAYRVSNRIRIPRSEAIAAFKPVQSAEVGA